MVVIALYDGRETEVFGKLNVIVSINPKDIFYHIARAFYIDAIAGNGECKSFIVFILDCHIKGGHDTSDSLGTELLTDEPVDVVVTEYNTCRSNGRGVFIADVHRNLSAGKLTAKNSCLLKGVEYTIRVGTTFKSERRIGTKAMAPRTFPNPSGMEICALEYDMGRCIVSSAATSPEDTGDAHRFTTVADGKVMWTKDVIVAIESHEGLSFVVGAYNDMASFNHVGIKAVERLPVGKHDVVGNVYDVVDRTQANGGEMPLEPVGRFSHMATGNAHTCVTGTGLGVADGYLYRERMVGNVEVITGGAMQAGRVAVLHHPCIEIACYAVVGERICTIRRNINLNHPITLKVIIFRRWLTHGCIIGQNDDTIVRGTDSYFVFGAYHAVAFYAAELRFPYNKLFIAIVKNAAEIGHNHLFPRCHIGCTTHYLCRSVPPEVYGGDMEMV